MADSSNDKILINVGLNADEAEQGLTALGQKIKSVSEQDLGTSNVQSYKFQIRQLTQELQKIEQVQGRNSAAFRQGATELGRLKQAAVDFKTQIEDFNPANKLIPIANVAKAASVAMMGVAGSFALFGIKGEKAEQVMLRLQGVLALSHAVGSVHELVNGYNSLINVLGLASTAAKKVDGIKVSVPGAASAPLNDTANATDVAGSTEEVTGDEAQTAAQTELNSAKSAGTEIEVASQEAQATGTAVIVAKTAALEDLTAATIANSEANGVIAASTGVVTVAEEAATGASVGLKVALWAIGIGLITTAIAYLVSNWDKVKTSIENLFPALKTAGDTFKNVENILLGVGSAVLHFLKSPIDAVITQIKVLVDVMKGDFKAAAQDFQDGLKQQMADLNVLANFKSGVADAEAKDAEAANKIRVQAEIDANERIIKERKALGESTYALQIKNQQLKNSILDKDADDYKKKLADGESEITVIQNEEIKKRLDAQEKLKKEAKEKADALRKADMDKLKAGNDEASKVILEGVRSQRDIELADADFKYNKLIALANKYGQDSSKLVEARKIDEARISKKYDDSIFEYLNKMDEESLTEFDKKRLQIHKEIEEESKNADAEQIALLERSKAFQLALTSQEEKLSNNKDNADTNLTNVETANRATVAPEGQGDSAQTTYNKEEAIRKAKLVALKAQYQQEQFLAQGNATKLASINANYNKATKESDDEATKAKIELAQKEKDAKIATYETVSDALNEAADIAGKQTVAGKVLAIAGATISTYLSAQKAYESVVSIPFIGPELGVIAAATAVAAGLANIKSIISVKVPGDGGAAGVTPSYQPPTINSTVLNQAQQGTQNVNVVNQPNTAKQQPVRAYVVEKDITSAQDRAAYLDRRSTLG